MTRVSLYTVGIGLCLLSCTLMAEEAEQGKHLFILSGQSNMAGLRPDESFTPMVQKAFGEDNVIVVKDAQGGQPIRRWYKNWKAADGTVPEATGDLYDRLMVAVQKAIKDAKIESVTFVWMQGERDAREKHGEVYKASLAGLVKQLAADLDRDDIHCVIGRLSDFDLENTRYPHWTMIRQAQAEFVKAYPRAALVSTDDLNDGLNRNGQEIKNDLHYSADGYRVFGQRLACRAASLIKNAGQKTEEELSPQTTK